MNAPQGSPEWLAARAGHATASCFADVLATIKSGEAASRRNYRMKLVTERLTGIPVEGYRNAAMDWGNEIEPAARAAYEARTGALVEEVGFMTHPSVEWCGASSDGLVGGPHRYLDPQDEIAGGLVQIKCPFVSTNHVETLIGGTMPSEHIAQVQGEMWVLGRAWCDFVSFDPRMPENLQLFVVRVARDEEYIKRLATEVQRFLDEVADLTARLLDRAA